ncbi:RNB domain-containing ribonuclease [Aquabacterium lacunae]|uniref:RNB domain-containing ribonuclease n=1 Tax=Aquabacterium lacunae TaxID=2528630 RepID=A0A4Q9GWJ3_9BURK|nr:ribonuclease catalytic domain-containing protein [Aquabacterium lacunae]TBO29421.1 RNB domain-containing ribonuclease [Aquabacterium lacunae]
MFALFDDAGKFLAGRVMSEAESSLQVELDSGKRVKVKAANVLIRFAKPAPAELVAQALAQSAEIDADLVWEVAPEEDFGFEDIASEYFGDNPSSVQQAAMLMRLFDTPHYFHRRGKGRFKKAPEDILKQALAAIERKKQQALQIAEWAQALAAGQCPAPIKEQLYRILFKPDKNGPEYKAVVEAAKASQRAPLDLLKDAGAIDSPYQFHWRRFLFEHFPKGPGFAAMDAPPITDELPLAAVQAFSIDDSQTTEIDDALSVQGLGTGTVTYGIHIAAPSLAIAPGTPIDNVARGRMSTVYMPGHKITMLPDEVVQRYTLQEGRDCPAVSLYVTFDETTLERKGAETRLERVPIAANLRHDQLDQVITEASLTGQAPADYAFAAELAFAFRLAKALKAQREEVRGKPENFNRPDYTFKLEGKAEGAEPAGHETVVIGTRLRGAPLDLIVAEAMILANSTWGGWLAECGVPGIYRSQASLQPGIKVRMSTKALPHAGMGVAQYTWATSPLRRYVDLVNQWQIVACARHGRTAALAAPFKPKDAELFAIISNFDAAYSAYNGFQSSMERYWTLKHLQQAGITELDCAVMVNGLVRADTLPLVFKALGCEALPRHTKVRVRVTGIDELTLDVHASLLTRLEDGAGTDAGDTESEDEGEALDNAGPLTLAIDLSDSDGDAPAAAPSSAPSA